MRHCTDSKVISNHAEMRKKIEEHIKSGRSLKPMEEADMGVEVRCAEALQQLSQTRAITISNSKKSIKKKQQETIEAIAK